MFAHHRFSSATESQEENVPATHYDYTDPASFTAHGLGFSICPVLSPWPLCDLPVDAPNVVAHLLYVLKIHLAASQQQVRWLTGDSLPTPTEASVILDIINIIYYLKRYVRFDSSTISHSDLDVPEVLMSCDFNSIFSTYVAVTPPSTLPASLSDELPPYLTRTEPVLSDYPVQMQGRVAALVSFVSGTFFSICRPLI